MSFGGMAFGDFAKETLFRYTDNEMMEEDRNQRQMFDHSERNIERKWQEEMAGSRYQRTMGDLRASGLNPMLAIGGASGAGVPGSSGSSAGGSGARHGPAPASMFSAAQAQLALSTADKTEAEAKLVEAQTSEVKARTETYPVSIEKMKQEISQSVVEINRIIATTEREYSTAQHAQQQIVNLKAVLPQIEETVKLIRAQTHESLMKAGLSAEQAKEVMQRIKANLPEVERYLVLMKGHAESAGLPQKQREAQVHGSPVGALSAFVRALNPLAGILSIAR